MIQQALNYVKIDFTCLNKGLYKATLTGLSCDWMYGDEDSIFFCSKIAIVLVARTRSCFV